MNTAVLVSIIAGSVLLLSIVIILAVRSGKKKRARVCGGCGRVLMAEWDRCLFCGRVPSSHLEFICGPLAGQVIELREDVTTLGSVAGNTIVLSDPAGSRTHLGIRRTASDFEMADLGSTNGVYVNGHRMPKKQLVSGDILRVGNTEMVFKQD